MSESSSLKEDSQQELEESNEEEFIEEPLVLIPRVSSIKKENDYNPNAQEFDRKLSIAIPEEINLQELEESSRIYLETLRRRSRLLSVTEENRDGIPIKLFYQLGNQFVFKILYFVAADTAEYVIGLLKEKFKLVDDSKTYALYATYQTNFGILGKGINPSNYLSARKLEFDTPFTSVAKHAQRVIFTEEQPDVDVGVVLQRKLCGTHRS